MKKILNKPSFRIYLLLFLFGSFYSASGQNCSVNAGINETICENDGSFSLSGSAAGLVQSGPVWSQISGPSVIIDDPNSPTSGLTGLLGGNVYGFRLSADCTDGSTQFQDVEITVQPITIADAGADIESCPDSSGAISVTGNLPANPGETGFWSIAGANGAGVTINSPTSPTTTINLSATSAGVTSLVWTITGADYAPGSNCESEDTVLITNIGGQEPVNAGSDQSLDNCYTVTQATRLNASFGGNNINGQNGSWSFVSGPSTPSFSDSSSNNSNVSGLIEGTYVLRWSVVGPCASGQDTMTITVDEATQDISGASIQPGNIRYCDPSITTATLVGSQPQFSGETVQWNQTGGPAASILNNTNSTTQITGLSSPNTYTFTYTITNATTGCSDTASSTIRYSIDPISITANGGVDIVATCGQTEVDIPFITTGDGDNTYAIVSGPSTSALVNPSNYQSTGSTPLSIDFDVEGTYTIALRRAVSGSVQTGCDIGTDEINVTISLVPTGSNAGTPQTLGCNVASTSLGGNAITIGNSLWTQLSGPNTATIDSPFTRSTGVSGLISGEYIFQYSITGGNACTPPAESSVSVTVSSDAAITTSAGPDQPLVCFGSPIQMGGLEASAANLVGTWSVDTAPVGANIVFQNENDPNTLVTGLDLPNETYIFTWTVANPNDNACPPPGTSSVTVTTGATEGPTTANAGSNQCLPSGTTVVNLAGNAPATGETGLWTALPNTGISFTDATTFNTTATVTIEQSYTLTWTLTKAGCQSSFDEVEITVNAPATADAGTNQAACSSTVTMAATSSTGNGLWTQVSGPGGYTINDETSPTALFTFSFSGLYVFEWTVNSGSCSSDTDQVELSVGIPPTTATVGADQTICNAASATLSGNGFDSNIENGFWTLLSGAPNTPTIVDVNDPNTDVTNLVSGSYVFRWTIIGDSNCPTTFADIILDVFAPADAGTDLQLCEVSNFLLEATFGSTGTWTQISTTGPNATIVQNPTNSSVAEVSITPGNTYVFQFETDYTTCPVTNSQVTVTSSTAPSIDPIAGPDQILCTGDLGAPFQTTLSGNAAPGDVSNAFWRFANVPSGSVAVIDNPTSPTSTLTGLSVPGIYILEWNFESGNCSDTADVVRIEVFEAPSAAAAGPDQPNACQLDAQMNAIPPTVGIGSWSFTADPSSGAAVIDSPNSPTTTLSNITTLGTYELTWTVSNGTTVFPISPSACDPSTDIVEITFTDTPPSEAFAGPDQEFCNATDTNLAAVPLANGTGTWSQTAGPGVTDSGTAADIVQLTNPSSEVTNLETGVYEFTWSATNGGCTLTDTMEIVVLTEPVTANAGPDQNLIQFETVTLAATPVTIGTGVWTQLSGPNTANFVDTTDPNTSLFGTQVGVYEFQWTVTNGVCAEEIDTMTVTIIGIADLELSKSVSPSEVNVGDTVTFTISIFNNDGSGGEDATGIVVEDIVPDGYTVVAGTVSNGGVYNPGNLTITWEGLAVPNGTTLAVSFNATVNATGTYDNSAEITDSDQFDPDSTVANNDDTEDDQSTTAITIQSADLSLLKSVSPTTASVGDAVTFTLTVSNAGTSDATGVALTDVVPDGYIIGTINDGGSQSGNEITWAGLTVTDGGSTSVSFTATVNMPTGSTGEYINTAEISAGDVNDPDSTPNNDDGDQSEDDESASGITLEQVDLALSISNSPTTGNAGDTVSYTVSLENDGTVETGDATGVDVVVIVPSGFTIVPGSISNGGVYNPGSGTITWSNQSVANGTTSDFTYEVTVNATGNYETAGEITASDLPDVDSAPGNDDGDQSEDDEASAPFALQSADLSLVKNISTASSGTPNIGDTVVFELTITNIGPDTATNVVIEDIVPRGYTLGTVNNGGTAIAGTFVNWDIASLPIGNTVLSYEVTVNEPSGDTDEYLNTAEVAASDQTDPDSAPFNDNGDQSEDDEDFFIITPQVIDLDIDISVNNPNPNVGETVTFSIDISNLGDILATGVSLEDILPPGFGNVTAISNGGAFTGGVINWSGLNVPVGSDTLTLTFNAEVLAPTGATDEYEHIAQITAADQFDTDSVPNNDDGDQSEDDEDNVGVSPQVADLSLAKTANTNSPNVGDTVVFTLTINNRGPNVATGVSLEDTLSAGFTLTAVNDGGTLASNTAGWTGLSVLANGGSTAVTYEATVNAPTGAVGEYLNEASITAADQFDPDSDPATGNTVDEDGDGQPDDDDEDALVLVPNIADLSLTKIVVDGDINPQVGSEISFEITVFNDGPTDANSVQVTDLLPSGFDYILYSSTAGIYNENTGIWQVGAIASGGTETLLIDVLVNPTGNYTNGAEVTASDVFDIDSTPNNNILAEDDQANVTVIPVNTIDISLNKTVNNSTPDVTTDVTFTITVSNDGPSDATNVQVLDLLPSGYTYVSDDASGAYTNSTGNWVIGNLANGASVALNIVARVNTTGVYTNIAEVISHTELDIDSTPNNDVLSEDDQEEVVVIPRQLVDVSVTKVANTLSPNIGGEITFTVTVTNDGPSDATNIVVTDLLESGYTFISATPSNGVYEPLNGSWAIGNLANGVTETIAITATVLANGTYTNTAELTDLTEFDIDSEPANNDNTEDDQETIAPVPVQVSDLELTKVVNSQTPLVGDEVIFTLSLFNNGPSNASGVTVVDILPDGYTYISDNSTAGVYDEITGLWNLNGVIPNGTTETLNIVVLVNPTGNYNNSAEITGSDNGDIDSTTSNGIASEDDQDNAETTPIPVADLSLVKTVDNEFPDVSDTVTFTLTLNNAGPSEATGIQVSEGLPSGYSYISDDSGGSYDVNTGIWNVPSLAADTDLVLNITVGINTTGSYANVAELIAVNELDPNSTPNNNDINEDDQDGQDTRPRVITDISILKTIDNINPSVGSQVTFTITITNDGPSDATGLVVEDLLASGYDFVSATTSVGSYDEIIGSWNIATLLNGASETLTVTAEVLTNGDYSNTAELIALDTFDPDSSPDNNLNSEDDQDTVNPVPTGLADLSLTKEADNLTPNVGDIVEFTINLTNSGASNATGVIVTDIVPAGYTYQSHLSTAGVYNPVTGIWNTNGTIPNGTTETLIVLLQVNAPTGTAGEYTNTAEITASNQADPDSTTTDDSTVDDYADGLPDDDEASVTIVPQSVDIAVTKVVSNERPKVGDEIQFTISLSNLGMSDATNIGIEEILPNGYLYLSSQASVGEYDPTDGFWEIAILASTDTATLTLTVKVLEEEAYLNTASLSYVDQIDLNDTNDSGSATIEPTCLTIYNEFSPNDDGVNEFFKIDCISRYPNNLLRVYNRWGNIVFEQQNYNNTWTGISNGRATVNEQELLPVGTYYYILDLGDGSKPIADWLYINR